MEASRGTDNELHSTDDGSPSPIPMPTFSSGLTTFGYQLVLRNRIPACHIQSNGKFDPHHYTPTFIHDIFMLPGSLANILDKVGFRSLLLYSPPVFHRLIDLTCDKECTCSFMDRLTPAILLDFFPYVHRRTLLPCLLPSTGRGAYVQGLLLFGEGTRGRDVLKDIYHPHARRVKMKVEIEVRVPCHGDQTEIQSGNSTLRTVRAADEWRLQRQEVMAHVFVWSLNENPGDELLEDGGEAKEWTLEAYLEGRL